MYAPFILNLFIHTMRMVYRIEVNATLSIMIDRFLSNKKNTIKWMKQMYHKDVWTKRHEIVQNVLKLGLDLKVDFII